jgi:spherulation-specific family 4 protein/chitobiase/beta-hexosaminidase-like protein
VTFLTKAFAFDKSGDTLTPVTQAVTGIGHTPKALLVMSTSNSSTGNSSRMVIGFSDGTNSRSCGWSSADNATTTNSSRIDSSGNVFSQIGDGGGQGSVANLTSFDADGFTWSWTTNDTSTYQIKGLSWGGTDITQVKVGSFTLAAGVTGLQQITGGGLLGPDCVFFMTTGAATLNTSSTDGARIAFGIGTSATRRAAVSTVSRDALTTGADTGRKQHATMGLTALSTTTSGATTTDFEFDYEGARGTNDGFTIDVTNAPSVDTTVFYMAIKGGFWDVSNFTSKTDTTGTQSVSTSAPAKGAFLFGVNTSSDTAASHARISFGAGTAATERWSLWSGDQDAANPTFVARSANNSSIHRNMTEAGDGTLSTINAQADFDSLTSTAVVLNWTTVVTAANAYRINALVFGDAGQTTTLVNRSFIGKYDILAKISKSFVGKYSMGGKITSSIRTHDYNILGKVNRLFVADYDIYAKVNRSFIGKYNLAAAAGLVNRTFIAKYDMNSIVSREFIGRYDIAEAPGLNIAGYLKPLQNRIYFMSNDLTRSFHTFNAFDSEDSTINVNYCDVSLSSGSAGEFTIRVEDSAHLLDVTEVGNGNAVLIQAAKTEGALADGKHNLIFGFIDDVDTILPDTNVLEYEFHGVGSAIRMMERISNFNRAARRVSQNSAEPDLTDPSMQAWRLVRDLMTDTDHLPIGEPLEDLFTINGVTDPNTRITSVVPSVQEEFAEFSEILNLIADTTGATWGVDYNPGLNDLFLRYAVLQPSGIILKDKIESDIDDRFKTAYIQDAWGWNDSTKPSDGYCNRFFAITATKDVLSNVISIPSIAEQFTPLCTDSPPGQGSGGAIPEGEKAAFGPLVIITHHDPSSTIWDMLENQMRTYPHITWRVIMKQTAGLTGLGYSTADASAWNDLCIRLDPLCYILCWCDLENGSKSLSSVQSEIDTMRLDGNGIFNFGGVFFENAPTNNQSYISSIATYAINAGMNAYNVIFNTKAVPPESYFTNTNESVKFVIYQGAGLPNMQDIRDANPWLFGSSNSAVQSPNRRGILCHTLTLAAASDGDIREFISQTGIQNFCNWAYYTDDDGVINGYWNTNAKIWDLEFKAMEDEAIRVLQNAGVPIPNVPTQQDLGMSFIAETQSLDDFAVIVSKIGNPQPDALKTQAAVYGEVLDSRINTRIVTDPETGQTSIETTEQPKNLQPIASFRIPFTSIQDQFPTIIFLHGIVNKKREITIGRRYWVVLYGTGHNEANTIRWHHSDNPGFDFLAARRVPATDYRSFDLPWETFSNVTHPGYALSNFRNTTKMMEASDGEAMDHFGIKESPLNLIGIKDDAVAIRTLHAILDKSSKPKRIYSIQRVTAPDDLILPGMLVTVQDSMTDMGQTGGGGGSQLGTEAEITEARYVWDATQDPTGCRYVEISAVGHVDWKAAYWKSKYDKGQVSFQFPDFDPVPTSPDPPNAGAPLATAIPRGGNFNSPVSVKFVSNKSEVSVFYTTNGNVPGDNVGGGSSIGTQLYTPGASPDIKINNTTTLRFKAVDNVNGKKSAVYAEKYTIGPIITPPSGEGKSLFLAVFQDVDVPTAVNIFKQYTNANLDRVTLHKRIEESLTTTNKNLVKTIPARQYEIEFQAYSQMDSYITQALSENFSIMGFNIERDDSPEIDTRNVISTINKFENRVNLDFAGLQVKLNPRHDYTETYGTRVARKANYFNLQAHTRQGDKKNFQAFVKKYAAAIRGANSAVFLTVTLSADLNQHESLPGKNRLETMKDLWQYAKNHVDGVRIFYKTTSELTSVVEPFLQWFNTTGRRL